MSIDRASSSSGSRRTPALPPFLHLAIPQENDAPSDHREGSKRTVEKFGRALHSIIFSKRPGMVDHLEKVVEAVVEDEDADAKYPSAPSRLKKHKRKGPPTSPPLTMASNRSQSTSSHFSARHSPHTHVTSSNVADIPSKSSTNKSQFSAALLSEEGEGFEADDPALALHTEQVHRARLAKLTRHFGEEITAEMMQSPTLLPQGASSYSLRSRRGERFHHRRRSLDPSTFLQFPPVADPREASLRRSRSLRDRDNAIPQLRSTLPGKFSVDSRVTEKDKGCRTDALKNTESSHSAAPNPHVTSITSTAVENRPKLPENDPDDQPPSRDRASTDTYSDTLMSPSTLRSVKTYSESSHFSPRHRSRTLPRRPATADATRRVEKLANFFGVDHDELHAVSQLHGAAQKLQFSASAAIGMHSTNPQLGVDVKITKPSRFWNLIDGRVATKPVHPDEVMKELRTMRAS